MLPDLNQNKQHVTVVPLANAIISVLFLIKWYFLNFLQGLVL